MYNAFSRKNIASEKTEEKIKDRYTLNWYEWRIPQMDEAIREDELHGVILWRTHPEREPDPVENLMAAVASVAARDYIDAVVDRNEPVATELREWFKQSGWAESVLDEIDGMLRKVRNKWELNRVRSAVRIRW